MSGSQRNPAILAGLSATAILLLAGCAHATDPSPSLAPPVAVPSVSAPVTQDTHPLPQALHPNAAGFQATLRQRATQDLDTAAMLVPVPVRDEIEQKLAVAFLDRLAADKLYMAELQHWLESHDALSLEDLIDDWALHHQEVILKSLDDLDHADQQLLWRLASYHSTDQLPRTICQSLNYERVKPLAARAQHKLIADHLDSLPRVLAHGYGKVLAAAGAGGSRGAVGPDIPIVVDLLRKLEKTLPAEDGKRIDQMFFPRAGAPGLSSQEACERIWVVSHAPADWHSIDGDVLLRNLLANELDGSFHVTVTARAGLARTTRQAQPKPDGFVPGDSTMHNPVLAAQNDVVGVTEVEIAVDAQGRAGAVTIVKDSLSPASVTSFDGTVFRTRDLFQAMYEHYYRAGSFPPKLVDGRPVPFIARTETDWTVKP